MTFKDRQAIDTKILLGIIIKVKWLANGSGNVSRIIHKSKFIANHLNFSMSFAIRSVSVSALMHSGSE